MGLWSGRNFEPVLRFLSGIIILPFLAQLPSSLLKKMDWGIILAAIGVCIYAVVSAFVLSEGRAENYFTCAITFGNVSLLLGFWSFISLYWDLDTSQLSQLKKILKLVGFFAGIYASCLSGSKGGWIALPLFIFIVIDLFKQRKILSKKYVAVLFSGCIILGVVSADFVSARINLMISTLKAYETGNVESSVGYRLQLWKGAIYIFKKHPILGVGKGKFQEAASQLATQEIIAHGPTIHKHAHNEILFMMAEFGIPGLIVLLVFYFGTFIHFYRYRKHKDITIKTAAYMGLILGVGLVVFGLTEVIFIKVKEIGFFVVMTCLFLGIIASRQRELRCQSRYYMY